MEVSFKNDKERTFYASLAQLTKKYGPINSKLIQRRLLELQAAPFLKDLPSFTGIHPLDGNRKGQYAVNLKNGYRIVFIPLEPFEKGQISTISKIQIIQIIDYH